MLRQTGSMLRACAYASSAVASRHGAAGTAAAPQLLMAVSQLQVCIEDFGRAMHTSAAARSNKETGPVEKKLRQEGAGFKAPEGMDTAVLKPAAAGKKVYRLVSRWSCSCVDWSMRGRQCLAAISSPGAGRAH
jgi:hypothetical protein